MHIYKNAYILKDMTSNCLLGFDLFVFGHV